MTHLQLLLQLLLLVETLQLLPLLPAQVSRRHACADANLVLYNTC